jgi:outer membrane immunogenic protein
LRFFLIFDLQVGWGFMRTNNLLASTALTTSAMLASGTAFAQPVTYNWTGFYVGINAGGGSTAIDHNVAIPAGTGTPARFFAFDGRDGSFAGGFQAGYNWQFAPNWVFGIEGDINYLRGSRDNAFRYTFDPGEDVVGNVNTRLRWLSTVRGRLGYTWASTMVYATGGLAIGGVRSNVDATRTDGGVFGARFAGSYSETRTGWAVGAGLEQALTNTISLRIEYLHFDLGSFSYDVTRVSGAFLAPVPDTWQANGQVSGDIVRAALNIRFGGP